ncbi:MAG: zinc ribbon domain-containing protein [Armatimonadota bacterium]|nr:zinc ribbon domain-containing protein [Armatimonadota bacterium]
MKCPNCGVDIDDTARFCPSCGTQAGTSERRPAPSLPKRPLIAALAVIGVLIAAALVFALLRPKGEHSVVQSSKPPLPSSSVVQSPVPALTPKQPLTQTNVPPAPSMPKAPPEEKAPPEVVQYIEFVKRVEDHRKQMRVDFNPAIDMLKSAYGAQLGFDEEQESPQPPKVAKGYEQYSQQWNQLVQAFDSMPAPEPCRPLAGAYRQALANYVVAMVKIQAAVVQNDLNTLMAMRGKAQPDIDEQLRQSDSQLGELTKRYRLEKTFSITADREVDTILGQ